MTTYYVSVTTFRGEDLTSRNVTIKALDYADLDRRIKKRYKNLYDCEVINEY